MKARSQEAEDRRTSRAEQHADRHGHEGAGEVRPAEAPRTAAGPEMPRERARGTARPDRIDASTQPDRVRETGDSREMARDQRDMGSDSSEVASDSPAVGKPRPPDRARPSTDRNGFRPKQATGTVEHLPGEVPAESTVDLWPGRAADGMRERWRETQVLFVDDPRAAAEGADAVLAETIEILSRSLESTRADLSEWRTKQDVDTEGLRVALQRYRTVLDRVLAL